MKAENNGDIFKMQKTKTIYKEFYTQGKEHQNDNFCSSKDTVKTMKQLDTEQKKILQIT